MFSVHTTLLTKFAPSSLPVTFLPPPPQNPKQGLIKAELDSCDGGRPVYLMGESFGGVMVMALAIKLEAYIDR